MTQEIVYGPVSSWRLARSLGVDVICREKVCSFNCTYCQIGQAGKRTVERIEFVAAADIATAVEKTLEEVEADVLTLSGSGEPTLASNLGEIITELAKISPLPIAVLTNSALIYRKQVREELGKAEIVKGKLDAPDNETFQAINCPAEGIELQEIIKGMSQFSREMETYFMLEHMFTSANMDKARALARLAAEIDPDEIQLNTPRRQSSVEPLTKTELDLVKIPFQEKNLNFKIVHEEQPPRIDRIFGEEKMNRFKRNSGADSQ